jgi:hypothetical protein
MSHLYIDESKAKGYTLVAAVVVPGDVLAVRKEIAKLRKNGQRRVHFVKEDDSRRREIISTFIDLGVQAHLYHAQGMTEAEGREACLTALVAAAAASDTDRIVLEKDESIETWDRQVLFRELGKHGARDLITYQHEAAHDEPLLWIPDGIAWSYSRGGDWRRRVSGLIVDVTELGR